MGTVHLILGRTRARRRRAVAHGFTGVDRMGRPDFLYITDTVRKKRTVQREFVGYRGGTTFPPEVMTLSELLERLIARHGDGRAVWEAGSVALIAERMLGPGWPWLASMGDPARVGADLAGLHADWDEAGQPELPPERAEIQRFLRALDRRLAEDPVRSTMGAALRRLLDTLAAPPEPLAAWMLLWPRVSIDDVLHPSPLRRAVVVRLARAWSTLGAHVTVGLESGRDLGGAEAGRFFEYDDLAEHALSLRAFAATRSFRRDLFRGLVEEGGEAAILLAGATEVTEVDPGAEPGEAEAADVTDALYLPAGATAVAGVEAVQLNRWPDAATEVRGIAHEVKAALLAGAAPESLVVAFPALPRYAPLVRRIFGELGVPVSVSAGTATREHPVARLLVDAVGLPGRGWPVQPLVAILAHDLVAGVDSAGAFAYGRACREAGHTQGIPPTGSGPAHEALVRAHAQLAPLAAPIEPRAWLEVLLGLAATWRLLDRAQAIPEPNLRARALRVIGAVLDAARQVAERAAAVEAGPWPAERLARLLEDTLAGVLLPDPDGGVPILGMLELRGLDPRQLWIGGLVADDFPSPSPDDYLLSRRERRVLDRLEPVDEGRYLLTSAIRNTVHGGGTVRLSWPVAQDGKVVACSPLLEDLLAVEVDGAPLRSRVRAPRLTGLYGPAEVARLVGAQLGAGGHAEGWDALVDRATVEHQVQSVEARRDPTGFGPWDGVLGEPPAVPDVMSVTGLERYLACPMRDLLGRVFGLEPESAFDPDLDAAARGDLVHTILEAFSKRLAGAGVGTLSGAEPSVINRCAAWLEEIARGELERAPEVAALRPAVRAWHIRRWTAGLTRKEPAGILAAWLEHEVEAPPAERVAVEQELRQPTYGRLRLKGRADRVDELPGGVLVLDYKTGRAPKAEAVRAGVRIQGLVYVDGIAEGRPGAAAYLELRRADDVRRSGWVGDPDVLAEAGATGKDVVPLDAALGVALRTHLADAGERMAAGSFHPSLAGEELAGCSWCELKHACRVDHERNARIAATGDPRWQAPLGPPPAPEDT